MANCRADRTPADPPMMRTRAMPSSSMRSTKASAWFSDDGSSGKVERRYPNRDGAVTLHPASTRGAVKASPWSNPPPVPWIIRHGGPLPAVAYSIAPKRPWNTVLPVLTRKRASAISAENARQASPPPAAAAADKPSTRNPRRCMRMDLCTLPLKLAKDTRPPQGRLAVGQGRPTAGQ